MRTLYHTHSMARRYRGFSQRWQQYFLAYCSIHLVPSHAGVDQHFAVFLHLLCCCDLRLRSGIDTPRYRHNPGSTCKQSQISMVMYPKRKGRQEILPSVCSAQDHLHCFRHISYTLHIRLKRPLIPQSAHLPDPSTKADSAKKCRLGQLKELRVTEIYYITVHGLTI
ncbi:hypothetical protein P153DRAFT_142844 [Dothidotthia symphoricarpi CBS 119687]|uniref:Uncharacterized protein n=1 Tax=Dothidotthia symphoricarpi CBS 119687 TaxID=1392245 RepID=A0A6A6A001_9PLEO|nr:uncharacterized protein P153DRAFT_142844 [Dothidotthia symphoricarpi CBS 119687]KAF2124018.1 hypothetical protein P153DRAFT_142844 [Dothidotthia symphoricarpi CBS 119687]